MSSTDDKKSASPSYFAAAVGSMSPWANATPSKQESDNARGLKSPRVDHSITHTHGISLKNYPADCPPLKARWFHAVDVPKRRPQFLKEDTPKDQKPPPQPKKFVEFSARDSDAIEAAYEQLIDKAETGGDKQKGGNPIPTTPNTSLDATRDEHARNTVTVPVNEDHLFDVDVEQRELAPVYWLGPVYEVRRGTWFTPEGSSLKPCEENLSAQLEEGYIKVKPFRYQTEDKLESGSVNATPGDESSKDVTPKKSATDLRGKNDTSTTPAQPQSHRLFGTYMNTIATYQDSTTAWLSSDTIMARVSSTVLQKFGSNFGAVKVIRGFNEPGKTEKVPEPTPEKLSNPALHLDDRQQKLLKRRSAPSSSISSAAETLKFEKGRQESSEFLSRYVGIASPKLEEAAADAQEEKEMEDDYNNESEDPAREIEHLLLITHGIGQRLSMRSESLNFIHDVNTLRKTLKSVYAASEDLQALNSEIDKLPKNCRVQVLPVSWRHLLDFPMKGLKQNRHEHDIGESEDEEEYPSLEDITVEGVPFVRSLITDLGLDILLYQSGYREHIAAIVQSECNRIHRLFLDRNPLFRGKVSLVGHSLGSAILFDLLCHQKDVNQAPPAGQTFFLRNTHTKTDKEPKQLEFNFDVEDFYCLGSPVALFQMVKGRTIAARKQPQSKLPKRTVNLDHLDDPYNAGPGDIFADNPNLAWAVSSPKCEQLYNIFHPSDPIGYRMEPLISTAMTSLKPQPLPYTKRGIFSTSTQGLTDIGARFGQSMSGLWSSFSSGITTNLINRSLGLSSEDVAKLNSSLADSQLATKSDNKVARVSEDLPALTRSNTDERMRKLVAGTAAADRDGSKNAVPTLIDEDMETLWTGFQKAARQDHEKGDTALAETAERAKKLKREETKLRALNRNGRVDYSIQESMLDFNPINTIASHMCYWADEDVSHFMLSQMLSRSRRLPTVAETEKTG